MMAAYEFGVLFMLVMPFALGGGVAFLLWRSARKTKPGPDESGSQSLRGGSADR